MSKKPPKKPPKKPAEKFAFPKTKPPEIAEDSKSLGEVLAFEAGIDLSSREKLNKFNKLLRDDGLENHIYSVICFAIYIVAGIAAVAFLFLAWHFLMPESWHWLTQSGIDKLQNFLFSGGLGAAITGMGKRVIKNENKKIS